MSHPPARAAPSRLDSPDVDIILFVFLTCVDTRVEGRLTSGISSIHRASIRRSRTPSFVGTLPPHDRSLGVQGRTDHARRVPQRCRTKQRVRRPSPQGTRSRAIPEFTTRNQSSSLLGQMSPVSSSRPASDSPRRRPYKSTSSKDAALAHEGRHPPRSMQWHRPGATLDCRARGPGTARVLWTVGASGRVAFCLLRLCQSFGIFPRRARAYGTYVSPQPNAALSGRPNHERGARRVLIWQADRRRGSPRVELGFTLRADLSVAPADSGRQRPQVNGASCDCAVCTHPRPYYKSPLRSPLALAPWRGRVRELS
ncbi:hypothetical protein C8Q79DRAFT_708878 [Trametes meyenii]|nr:hypothetical protein C8Q79DRAFT_708878 [Trametes meyenii]